MRRITGVPLQLTTPVLLMASAGSVRCSQVFRPSSRQGHRLYFAADGPRNESGTSGV
ncbi:MAG: hypothetical protein IPP83_16145 [Flavobacteriales bacterium]|nr:hypothetical protein [Flavobacteriales bacterium]